jgi:ABC-type transport system involved in cytochrome c biogenesis permease subunit
MNNIVIFNFIAGFSIGIGLVAVFATYFVKNQNVARVLLAIALAALLGYISFLWIKLGRAPLRTLGETRLWYAFFVALIGFLLYFRYTYKWMLLFTVVMIDVFLMINLLHPENFDKTLMPALQSYWFVPHVIIYIFAYSILGVSAIFAVKGLYQLKRNKFETETLLMADMLVHIGFAFSTIGMLFGALWAKEAWGHYWSWDPKETWALITWLIYMLYIHYRLHKAQNIKVALYILVIAYLVLLVCWFGVNYLPSAQNSVHVYSR